jgi:hypothetical protein
MAWSVLTWKILRILQSQFLSGKICAETRHSSYTSTLALIIHSNSKKKMNHVEQLKLKIEKVKSK